MERKAASQLAGKNMPHFLVSDEQEAKINGWLDNVVYPDGVPYQGAIGGGVTYEFTPTSIGTVFKVKANGKELDLSDYDSW